MECGPGSSVRITTAYWLDGPGIEYRWGEIFCICPDRPWGQTSLLYNGTGSFPRVACARAVTLTTHPF